MSDTTPHERDDEQEQDEPMTEEDTASGGAPQPPDHRD
jgi:hypothetical protein